MTEKLKFGDVAVKEAAARHGRERAKFERLLDRAIPAMRRRYLMLLGRSGASELPPLTTSWFTIVSCCGSSGAKRCAKRRGG